MTEKERNFCLAEIGYYNDENAFISDLALSSLWGDDVEENIPAERIDELRDLWFVVKAPMKELIAPLTMKQASEHFYIPYRTMQDWCSGSRNCPIYVRLMIASLNSKNVEPKQKKKVCFRATNNQEVYIDVDLDELASCERFIVENIYTTDNRDDLSKIFVYSKETEREWYQQHGADPRLFEMYGEFLDRPLWCVWHWDRLRDGETPKEYFGRHIEAMREIGGVKIVSFLSSDKAIDL